MICICWLFYVVYFEVVMLRRCFVGFELDYVFVVVEFDVCFEVVVF